MSMKDAADKAREIIDRAKFLIDEAKRNICLMVFSEIIVPYVKEYKVSLKWRMGCVLFIDQYGEVLEYFDIRTEKLNNILDEVLEDLDISQNNYDNLWYAKLLWWVLCEQNGEALNHLGNIVDWDDKTLNPPTSGRKIRFQDLEKGDYVYLADYKDGDIGKIIVESTYLDEDGMLHIKPLNPRLTEAIVKPTLSRSEGMFTNYQKAEKSIGRVFDKLANYYDFAFKPEDPLDIIRKVLR